MLLVTQCPTHVPGATVCVPQDHMWAHTAKVFHFGACWIHKRKKTGRNNDALPASYLYVKVTYDCKRGLKC